MSLHVPPFWQGLLSHGSSSLGFIEKQHQSKIISGGVEVCTKKTEGEVDGSPIYIPRGTVRVKCLA